MRKTRSFTTTILWAFIILNISSIMILTFSIKHEDGERALNSAKTSLLEIVTEKSELISISLKNIEDKTENMADWMEYFLAQDSSDKITASYYVKNGVLVRKEIINRSPNNYSAVFSPNNIAMTPQIIKEINMTENMDPIFSKVLQHEIMLQWVYIATKNELLRVLPFYDVGVFKDDHWQTGDTFYQIANEKNNPERDSVWTSPYVDYLGTGWTISCSHPVYDSNNNMFGVVCADVGIDELKERFLEGFKLGESGKIYLLTDSGSIIYHPDYQIRAEKQGELYNKNIFDDNSISPVKIQILKQALLQKESLFQFTDHGQEKMLSSCRIDGQPWTVIIEINKKEFLSQNRINGETLAQLILIGIILAIVLVVILYYEFSIPMKSLVEGVRTLSEGGFGRVRYNTGFLEINELSEAFNNMNDNLQKYTESILQKNNEITTVLNAIDGVLVIIDTDKNVRIANKRSEERLLQENRHIHKCYAILANRNEICEYCILDKILREKQPAEKNLTIGSEIYKNIYYPIIETNGEIKEIVILSQCITKSIAMKTELQQIEKMAEIGQFSAAIAHEIKNPLAVIKGAAYIMKTYNKGFTAAGAYTEEIAQVENAVKEAEHVIATLLDFSSRDTGVSGLVDLKKIIEQILMISNKEIIKKDIKVSIDIKLEPFFYSGKIEPIKIILQNLINNSIQAINKNGQVCVYAGKTSENQLSIIVKDNGSGISIRTKAKIFEPFITTKKESGGTGIGLWITKTLVDGMDGSICLDEEISKGTEIKVILPIIAE